jgi:hypothetical protein
VAYWATFFSIGEPTPGGELSPAFEASGRHDMSPSVEQAMTVRQVRMNILLSAPSRCPG